MRFTSNIGKEELLSVYSQALVDAEKKVIVALLGLGVNPDSFEPGDVDSIEASLLENDVEGRDRIEVLRKLLSLIDVVNGKIEAL